ncbi:MAG TPA: hypothetical protein VLA87_04690 [Gaiellaceae bacterium]|nr:hypothetical protein [Gaiellaceae bacterium]
MRFRRVLIPALLAAALLALLAGCGSTGQVGSATSAVPASALAYVSVDTSFEGDQWQAVSGLLARFPNGEGLLEELLERATAEAGLESDADLRAALGPEVALVVLDVPTDLEADPPLVVLTKPEDEDAFAGLLEGEDAARAEVEGWQAVAKTEADLERYREALEGPSLDESEEFAEAMDDLPADALARVYVNGGALAEAFSELPTGAGPIPFGFAGAETGSLGAALVAEEDGVRVEGRAVAADGSESPELGTFESELVEEVPASAVAFLAFNDLGAALEQYADALGAGGAPLPFDLDETAELLSGEIALSVRPGPAVTLVAQVEDEAAALAAVESLLGLAGGRAPVVYDAFDGLLAVSNSQAELDVLRGDAPRLDQDDRFEAALEAAGMPDETSGFGYVDLRAAVPLVAGLAPGGEGGGYLPEDYLEPLGGLVFWGEASGDAQRFSLFLAVD